MIGGQHRYAADQFGGGRSDGHAMAAVRAWWAAGVCAAGLPMMFMGESSHATHFTAPHFTAPCIWP